MSQPSLCPHEHAASNVGTYIRILSLSGCFLPSHSRLTAICLKQNVERSGQDPHVPACGGGCVSIAVCTGRSCLRRAPLAARGPRAVPGSGGPCRRAGQRPQHLAPQVTPPAAPGTRHPAPGLRCGVPGRLPRQNREPEEERADRPPAVRLPGLQPSPPAPQHQPCGRASLTNRSD